jgi:hypothetical protein
VTRHVYHSLVVKCPTWDHVEAFYARKVKAGGALNVRVPFQPTAGEVITLALELPDQLVIAIDGEVEEVALAPDGRKSAVRLRMIGLTSSVKGRLESLVAESRRERAGAGLGPMRRGPASGAPPVAATALATPAEEEVGPPPPLPTDAPVDELVEPLLLPQADQVPLEARPVFQDLERELRRMREVPAHQVLGVRWDAEVDEIRKAYFALSKRLHPDVLARHRSAAIQVMASEVWIHVNRSYDRMRDAAVASGRAIAAGPDLLPHRGWMAGFEDIGGGGGARTPTPARGSAIATPSPFGSPPDAALTSDGLFSDLGATASPPLAGGAPVSGPATPPPRRRATGSGDTGRGAGGGPPPRPAAEVMVEARALMAGLEWGRAREILAESLRREPRNRSGRALYHLASAQALLMSGKPVEATTQLEVALAHDPTLEEARAVMESMRQDSPRRSHNLLRRLFR